MQQVIASLTDKSAYLLKYCWAFWARPKQVAPKEWSKWLILAGRGFGKTRTGAETVREYIRQGKAKRIALVGETVGDVRDTMIKGTAGLLNICPDFERPIYKPSTRSLEFPNGALALTFASEAYEQLRGHEFDFAWVDELAKFYNARETWEVLQFCMRYGNNPKIVITTTPQPMDLLRKLVEDEEVVKTKGSTFENRENLAASALLAWEEEYGDTKLGRQELYAEILEDNPDALWKEGMFKRADDFAPERVVVGVDPPATTGRCGVVVACRNADGTYGVLADRSMKGRPAEWGRAVVEAYKSYDANVIVGEINQGGHMVREVIENIEGTMPFKAVRASKGKVVRAEPVAALYEQGKVYHRPHLKELESEMLGFNPPCEADRVDALVWALTELKAKAPNWGFAAV